MTSEKALDFIADVLIDIGIEFQVALNSFGFHSFLSQAGEPTFFPPSVPWLRNTLKSAKALISAGASESEKAHAIIARNYCEIWLAWWNSEHLPWGHVAVLVHTAIFSISHKFGSALPEILNSHEAAKQRARAVCANKPFAEAREFCIAHADKIWRSEYPSPRMSVVVGRLHDELIKKRLKCPKRDKIRAWLINAQTLGALTIPADAQKAGRPKVTSQ